jgi:hypothetical protein
VWWVNDAGQEHRIWAGMTMLNPQEKLTVGRKFAFDEFELGGEHIE